MREWIYDLMDELLEQYQCFFVDLVYSEMVHPDQARQLV
jgi:hypothetical protein